MEINCKEAAAFLRGAEDVLILCHRNPDGDTLGIGGIFRALRTIPVMKAYADDMERWCPNALFLNYTNPMAMLAGYMQRYTNIRTVGLCHSVQGCASGLLGTLGGGNAVIAPIMLPIMAPAVRRRPRAAVATGLVLCISLAFSTKSLVDAAKILTWLPAPEACTI